MWPRQFLTTWFLLFCTFLRFLWDIIDCLQVLTSISMGPGDKRCFLYASFDGYAFHTIYYHFDRPRSGVNNNPESTLLYWSRAGLITLLTYCRERAVTSTSLKSQYHLSGKADCPQITQYFVKFFGLVCIPHNIFTFN